MLASSLADVFPGAAVKTLNPKPHNGPWDAPRGPLQSEGPPSESPLKIHGASVDSERSGLLRLPAPGHRFWS